MLRNNFLPNEKTEKRQLEVLAIGLFALGLFFGLMHHRQMAGAILTVLALVSAVGRIFFKRMGRDVYLCFALVATGIGWIISNIVMLLLYLLGIVVVGSILKLMKIDQLEKNWAQCKAKPTLFKTAPETTKESFERLS